MFPGCSVAGEDGVTQERVEGGSAGLCWWLGCIFFALTKTRERVVAHTGPVSKSCLQSQFPRAKVSHQITKPLLRCSGNLMCCQLHLSR